MGPAPEDSPEIKSGLVPAASLAFQRFRPPHEAGSIRERSLPGLSIQVAGADNRDSNCYPSSREYNRLPARRHVEPAVPARGIVRFVALAVILIVLAGFWITRGRLQALGLDFLAWNRTPGPTLLKAVALGAAAALAVAWVYRSVQTGLLPTFADLTMGVTLGPLVEELVFRGILFYAVMLLLSRWMRDAGWPTVIVIAAVFAASHAGKAGITALQIGTIFLTGTLYGWLRKGSGSTVPPFCAHVAYNALLLAIAFVR